MLRALQAWFFEIVIHQKEFLLSRDLKGLRHDDTRVAQHKVAELIDHTSEVYGLKWNSNGDQLASGGIDNRVNIWDARASTPRLTKNNHVTAVKALSWCPWQSHILASGGASDENLKFWRVFQNARKNEKSKNSDKENTGSVFGGCTIR
ncbi:hypothetical protein RhiirA5_504139 [Rhizophagus irregularis]|uniref:Uncharacterized protein n=1 Tax=Rhizophagus irregularis TaxID=588596 RepID=A0A2N0P607_9GLOM|nr:hypothetical protein RhiirA5_504139 [Rhizophagus irregularis]